MKKNRLPPSSAVHHPLKKKPKTDSSLSKPKTNSSKGKSLNKSSKNQKPNSKQVGKNVWWFTHKVKKQEQKNAGTTEKSKNEATAEASSKSSKTEVGESNEIESKKKALQLKRRQQRKNRLLKKKKEGGTTEVSETAASEKASPKSSKTEVEERNESKKKALQLKKKRQRKNRLLKKKKDAGTTEMSETAASEKASPKSSKTEVEERNESKKKALQLKKKRQRKNRLLKKKLKSNGNTEGEICRDSRAETNMDQIKRNFKSKDLTQAVLKSNQLDSEFPPSASLQKSGGQKQKRKKVKKFKGVKSAKDGCQISPGLKKETQVKGASTEEDSTKNEKDSSKDSQVEAENSSTKSPDKVSKGEVSSNWKALLPMVEKSRNERKKYKKKDKSGENKDNPKPSKPDIWFDDVDPSLIRANENEGTDDDEDDVQSGTGYNPLLRKDAQVCLTKCLAIDCEMVGTGPKGCKSILARVSIVNQYGYCVCDKYITPREPVTDYRTFVSGIRPRDLETKGESFESVQKEVSDLLKGRVVVGHALSNDFKVLFFNHPRRLIRDTSTYQPFKNLFKSKRPGLKKLTELVLKVKVQTGEHNSVEDAQAAMKLYMMHRKQWEKSLRDKKVSSASASSKTRKLVKKTVT